MRYTRSALFLSTLLMGYAQAQFQVVPPAYTGTPGNVTFAGPLATTPRTYQLLIHEDQLTSIVGMEITAISWRIPTTATSAWPPADVTINNYDLYLSGSVPPASRNLTDFSSNVVGPQTQVRSGSLLIPANAYPFGGTPNEFGPEITFNTPWVYTGGHLLIEMRHDGFTGTSRSLDAAGTSVPGYGSQFSACWGSGYTANSGSQGNFSIVKLSVSSPSHQLILTSPNGGEILVIDSTFQITWTRTDSIGTINIDYSTNNGTSWVSVASAVPDSPAVYPWTVPNTPTTQGLVRIRSVGDTSISDQSDNPFTISPLVNVGRGENQIPAAYALLQNYPNPFNPSTTIQFELPEESAISLKVYDILGQEVITLAEGVQKAGYHEATWNGCNSQGKTVVSGVYFYRFNATGVSGTSSTSFKKALFLK